jgi:S-adenosyl-L-methionine hydrolase (adenosine-forming)
MKVHNDFEGRMGALPAINPAKRVQFAVPMSAPIVMLTDFGHADPYVGIMKGVIAQIAPAVPVIDLTHMIPPGDVQRAALVLWQSLGYFPNGSVFLAVVDPGVGTGRKGLAVRVRVGEKHFILVGPDNGLFSFVLREAWQAWELSHAAYRLPETSHTFHGRDIFAPAAAHAANGLALENFGPVLSEPVRLPNPRLETQTPGQVTGEVLYADHFGNLITSLGCFTWEEGTALRLEPWLPGGEPGLFAVQTARLVLPGGTELPGGRVLPGGGGTLPVVHTFQDVPAGEAAGLVGSSGLLEIVVNQGSAAEILALSPGATIILRVVASRSMGGSG